MQFKLFDFSLGQLHGTLLDNCCNALTFILSRVSSDHAGIAAVRFVQHSCLYCPQLIGGYFTEFSVATEHLEESRRKKNIFKKWCHFK